MVSPDDIVPDQVLQPITQLWPEAIPPARPRLPKQPEWYLCFSADHDEDLAAARFVSRFGYPPERIFEADGILHLGPVR
jgi:hypothetical protein